MSRHGIEYKIEQGDSIWQIPHSANTGYLTHDYFRYIGKLTPQLARCFVDELCPERGLVLDPMCGGGTVLTEAVVSKRRTIGFDVNPVARLVSKVVSSSVDVGRLSEIAYTILDSLRPSTGALWSNSDRPDVPVLDLGASDKYFSYDVRQDLNIALAEISSVGEEDIRDFLTVALLSVLRSVSLANVKKMNVVVDKNKRTHKTVYDALSRKLFSMMRGNEEMNQLGLACSEVVDHDATKPWPAPEGRADLIILHPPYLTNTAFSEFTQLQLALLGTDHKKIWKRELRNRGSYIHEPNGLKKYLVGWHRMLEHAYRALKPDRYCAVVVGDGKIDFVRIPVGTITTEFASDIGFSVEELVRHRLNNNTGLTLTQKMREQHIIVLKK